MLLLAPSLFALASLTPANLATGGEDWQTNLAAAKAQAKAEKKDLLLDFTGSDWCGFCIKLHDEVFSKDEFKAEASKYFVFVELDFPNKKVLPAELVAQNDALNAEYLVSGYPTLLLMDPAGRVYGQMVGYKPGSGVAPFLEKVTTLRKARDTRDAAFDKAAAAKGADKAKLLDEGLAALEENVRKYDGATIDAIIAADADGKAGLKAKYETLKSETKDAREFHEVRGKATKLNKAKKFTEAADVVAKFIEAKKPTGKNLNQLLGMRCSFLAGGGDYEGAAKVAAQLKEIDEKAGTAAEKQIEATKKRNEAAAAKDKGEEGGEKKGK